MTSSHTPWFEQMVEDGTFSKERELERELEREEREQREMEQDGPAQVETHMHMCVSRSHDPCPEQLEGHTLDSISLHVSPITWGVQRHIPEAGWAYPFGYATSQTPRPLQKLCCEQQSRLCWYWSQSLPVKPLRHLHTGFSASSNTHTPCLHPTHKLFTFPQSAPVYPWSHEH